MTANPSVLTPAQAPSSPSRAFAASSLAKCSMASKPVCSTSSLDSAWGDWSAATIAANKRASELGKDDPQTRVKVRKTTMALRF